VSSKPQQPPKAFVRISAYWQNREMRQIQL
jgi:hypothetical protein